MIPLRWDDRPVGLRDPALVCAFTGWTDAGDSASSAVGVISRRLGAQRCATVDPELLYTMQSYRPHITIRDGIATDMDWPTVELRAAVVPTARRDLILVTGPEPAMRWQSLSETLIETAKSLGATFVVTLGGLLSDVPHTRPVPITGVATDPDSITALGAMLPDYEGPTGLTGVVHHEAQKQGLQAVTLLAHVPHYVAGVPSPKATLALVEAVEALTQVPVPTARLRAASERYEQQVSEAVERDPERRELLERLEQMADLRDVIGDDDSEEDLAEAAEAQIQLNLGELPTGDVIADDFLEFLREQDHTAPDEDDDEDADHRD
ncbi:PAC2 family protein [Patulibacter minatonensis]|uniref:PAC2 family protein n=1 Tax=Patulibacter minatonensis TaxID=298163 RepID=UPI000A0458CA|nr:PAC2 family protein [Patulibacter minatonensis]